MRKADFLSELHGEGKIKLVEPSEEIKESYLEKSESYLASAKLLLHNNKLEEAVSLAYYSMYYSLLALLFRVGIKSENHAASIILLKELFGLDNKKIYRAKKERIDKQYYVGFKVAKSDVVELIKTAEEFDSEILDFLEKLNNERIVEARNKFKSI